MSTRAGGARLTLPDAPAGRATMQRITITIEDDLLETVDAAVRLHGYTSRSEAIRDMIRGAATKDAVMADDAPCLAMLAYVYDHETRALAQRLTQTLHDHHDLTIASLHVHLDHDACLEVSALRGPAAAVRSLSDVLTAQRGVRHARLHLIPADLSNDRHDHGAGAMAHTHIHA